MLWDILKTKLDRIHIGDEATVQLMVIDRLQGIVGIEEVSVQVVRNCLQM